MLSRKFCGNLNSTKKIRLKERILPEGNENWKKTNAYEDTPDRALKQGLRYIKAIEIL